MKNPAKYIKPYINNIKKLAKEILPIFRTILKLIEARLIHRFTTWFVKANTSFDITVWMS
ncbi:hypothetical protein FPFC_040830 [Fructobacillus pseudoficulneus]|uniref:Uncharacterized protein n=1 Tax=Fructobacillus pseudoficulneus TaxID=220714 RepID=A0A3F3H593_9LACO|nr:hypothetical protein FPFC_040830 [Fructobacillus pseudoficulneus]